MAERMCDLDTITKYSSSQVGMKIGMKKGGTRCHHLSNEASGAKIGDGLD